jgi:hypothetical protein
MDLEVCKAFFMWCSILNASLLLVWSGLCVFAPDWLYRTQSRWFPMPREKFNIALYAFLGGFKLFVLGLNVVPYVALVILT